MKSISALDYPHIKTNAAYNEAASRLGNYWAQLEAAKEKLAVLEFEYAEKHDPNVIPKEKSVADRLADADALISGRSPLDSLDEQIQSQKRLISALTVACRLQGSVVDEVMRGLSAEAGAAHLEKHKELVRRMMKLQQELHEVNEEEYQLRANLDRLGYHGAHLTPMHMPWVEDPADKKGNHPYYWAREAREYLQTPEEREAAQAKAEAEGRRKRLANLGAA